MNINATDNRLLVNSLVVGNTGNKLVINTDGSINVSGGGGGGGTGGTVTVENNVITSPIVKRQTYDLELNNDLYSGSTGDNDPPFQRDILGNQGWYYINTDPLKSANVYYYLNIPVAPLTLQTDIALTQINFFYAVLTINYVGTNHKNLPFLTMASQAVGENDYIENVANTVYKYTLPAGNYISGEAIVIYWSDAVNKKPLETFMPNLRRIKLLPASQFGPNPTIYGPQTGDKLAYFSVNTDLGVTQKQDFTLLGAGYKFDLTGGEQEYTATLEFEFTAPTVIESKLSKLTFNEGNELLVVTNTEITGGGNTLAINGDGSINVAGLETNTDGSLNTQSIISATNSEDAEFPMTLFAKAHRLFTNTEITSGGNTLAINEDGSINVAGGGGGGGGGQVQGIDTTSGLAVNINATDNRLLTNSVLVNSTGLTISSTNTGDKECLDVAVISNSSVVRGYDAATSAAVDINATDNRLKTNSLLIGTTGTATEAPVLITAAGNLIVEANAHDGTNNPITSTVVGADRGLNVYIVGGGAGGTGDTLQGTYNNIHTGDLTASTFSTALNINNLYGNESVISYEDTLIGSTNFISIYGSLDNDTNYFYIGVLQPVLVRSTLRQASSVLKLKGLKWIKIYNENTTATLTGVKSTLFSG
jgi:hypothetical protein